MSWLSRTPAMLVRSLIRAASAALSINPYRDRQTARQSARATEQRRDWIMTTPCLKRPDEVNQATKQARALFVGQDTATGIYQTCIREQIRRNAVIWGNIFRTNYPGYGDVLAFIV